MGCATAAIRSWWSSTKRPCCERPIKSSRSARALVSAAAKWSFKGHRKKFSSARQVSRGIICRAAARSALPLGDGGLLVEPEPEPLAAAIVSVLNDPAHTADLRARGLARAAEFSWARTARLTMAAYEEAIRG